MRLAIFIQVGLLGLLAGCAAEDRRAALPVAPSNAPLKMTTAQLVGRWGLGAYHQEDARARTIPQARSSCGNAYIINPGTNGGVLMHVADSADLFELQLRVGPDGKTYLGPEDKPPGSPWDREIVSYDKDVITARWVDPEVAGRYGTMIFVRCK